MTHEVCGQQGSQYKSGDIGERGVRSRVKPRRALVGVPMNLLENIGHIVAQQQVIISILPINNEAIKWLKLSFPTKPFGVDVKTTGVESPIPGLIFKKNARVDQIKKIAKVSSVAFSLWVLSREDISQYGLSDNTLLSNPRLRFKPSEARPGYWIVCDSFFRPLDILCDVATGLPLTSDFDLGLIYEPFSQLEVKSRDQPIKVSACLEESSCDPACEEQWVPLQWSIRQEDTEKEGLGNVSTRTEQLIRCIQKQDINKRRPYTVHHNASMDNPYATPLQFPLTFLIPSWVSLCQAMTVSPLLLNDSKMSLSVNVVYVNSKEEWFQLVDCFKSFARYTNPLWGLHVHVLSRLTLQAKEQIEKICQKKCEQQKVREQRYFSPVVPRRSKQFLFSTLLSPRSSAKISPRQSFIRGESLVR